MSSRPGEDVGVTRDGVGDVITPLEPESQSQRASGITVALVSRMGGVDVDSLLLATTLGDNLKGALGVGLGVRLDVHVLIMSHRLGVDNRCLTM